MGKNDLLTAKTRFHSVSSQFHSLGLGINTMMSLVKKITIFETCLFMTTEEIYDVE